MDEATSNKRVIKRNLIITAKRNIHKSNKTFYIKES